MLKLRIAQETTSIECYLTDTNIRIVSVLGGIMEEKMDLRIRKTYLALHSAFTQLLEEKKFEEFTINELCDRAMIRRTTFYKHFADKYEYFTFYLKETVQEFQNQIAPDIGKYEANAYLLHMSQELVRFIDKHEQMVCNIRDSSMFPLLLSILLENIGADMRQKLLRADWNTKLTTKEIENYSTFFAGGLLNILFQQIKTNDVNEDALTSTLTKFLLE